MERPVFEVKLIEPTTRKVLFEATAPAAEVKAEAPKRKLKLILKKKTPPAEPKKEERRAPIQGYFDKLLEKYLIEQNMATESNVDDVVDKLRDDNDEYNEAQEDMFNYFGGYDEIADKTMKHFLKKKFTKTEIINGMKDMQQEGFIIFDDLIEAEKAAAKR